MYKGTFYIFVQNPCRTHEDITQERFLYHLGRFCVLAIERGEKNAADLSARDMSKTASHKAQGIKSSHSIFGRRYLDCYMKKYSTPNCPVRLS